MSYLKLGYVLALFVITHGANAQTPAACCTVTAIDATTGLVSARVTATSQVFQFRAADPRSLGSLRVGAGVYANFTTRQVSLDGRSACCPITSGPGAPSVRAPVPAPAPSPPSVRVTDAVPKAFTSPLPSVTYGDPIPAAPGRTGPKMAALYETRTVTARAGGRNLSATMLHLNGREGIASAPSILPDGARTLLEMHVRKLAEGESQYYLVNPALAVEWLKTHPVPPGLKPKKEQQEDSECGKWSINGVKDCGNDAVQSVAQQIEHWRKQAQDWWDESTDKLASAWNEAKSCFADHTLSGPTVPVAFSTTKSLTVDMEQSGARGSAKGALKGSVTLGIPMEGDFQAKAQFFYIPCLPFVARPKSLGAAGHMTVGQQLSLNVEANGSFTKRFTVPPSGGFQIPLYVIPIMIGDVPIAVIDVSAYLEGEVDVAGEGKATGHFSVTNSHRSDFDFTCDGQGCDGTQKGSTSPTTTNESAQIEGQVSVQPGIFTALQLSLDYNLLSARAGPQPFLLGVASGCGAISATQTSGAAATTQTNVALAADLDWGIKVRAEALAGGQPIGKRWEETVRKNDHLWFRDLAPGGSTALVAAVTANGPAIAAQPASFKVRMPSCYPFTEPVQYQVSWTGGAAPSANPGAACQWQAGAGKCRFDPTKDLVLSFTWPSAGAQSVSVSAVKDDHRTFAPMPATAHLSVSVAAPGGGNQP